VPDPAAALPEIADRQAHVLEACGLELHLLEQLVGQELVLVALAGQPAQLLKASCERVASALELIEAEQRGAARAGLVAASVAAGGFDERESIGDDRRELALEPVDLGAQRPPRLPLAVRALSRNPVPRSTLKNQLTRSSHTALLPGCARRF
jgi:hypothetical protein